MSSCGLPNHLLCHAGDGSRYGPQPQYFKQVAGDGLLGSGASPNVFPCTAGTSAPKFEARHQYELPYRPSQFSKVVNCLIYWYQFIGTWCLNERQIVLNDVILQSFSERIY